MSLTIDQYWMGRDVSHAAELTDEIRRNAALVVERVNKLLAFALGEGNVTPGIDQVTHNHVASGWRPASYNHALERTMLAAASSRHITGQAVDLQDTPDRALARWCLENLDLLDFCGLWMERPQWTGGADPWVHLQTVPPKSGRRVYIPSTSPATAEALPGEDKVA